MSLGIALKEILPPHKRWATVGTYSAVDCVSVKIERLKIWPELRAAVAAVTGIL
jgi:hypothetical protein